MGFTECPQVAGSSTTSNSSPQTSRKRHIKKDLQRADVKPEKTLTKIVTIDNLESGPDFQIQIERCKFLASYNWTKAMEPTIFIPGAPALWIAPTLPIAISKDDGKAGVDQNFDRVPAPSFAPFFAAILTMQPSYSFLPTALITDRNSLRKLLDFASGHRREDWRIEVELVKETLFLTRWEKNWVQIITGSFNSGYGHEFENAFLKFEEGLEDSSTHHRIVEYEIGGMKWVVRFEADGYIKDDPGNEGPPPYGVSQPLPEISATMEALSLESASPPRVLEGVGIVQRGHLVSPKSIIEVKCTKSKNDQQLGEKVAQCWFSQTRHVFIGHHKDGLVEKVTRAEMSSTFDDWEKTHQDEL
ncbi:hypothetical protein BDZ45DRAFT_654934, partial [Acephala macrosclerotiorum]